MQMHSQSYLVIRNGTLITPNREIREGVLVIRGATIVEAGKQGEVQEPENAVTIDAGNGYISPGLIDIQVNGANGADVTKAEPDTFERMGRFFAGYGVTSYVGTAITSSDGDFLNALNLAREHMKKNTGGGAELLGIHMEGPYLSPGQSGAHPREFLALPRSDHYRRFLEHSDVLKKMTVAPELDGAVQLVKDLRERGIVVSAGHTNGIFPEIIDAINAGISHATHFYCNMSHFRRDNLKRVAGVVETLLYDDRVTAGLIGDGWHVGPQLMKLLIKVKGVDRVCFVTDAMPAVGLPEGVHKIGEVEAVVENGIARLRDNTAYAGSVTTMDVCLKNGIRQAGLSLVEAVRMSSLTPAEIMGVNSRKGSLEKGKDADIVIFGKDLEVKKTIGMGTVIYERE